MRIFGVSGIIVLLDQITKILTKTNMYYGQSIPIAGNFIRFTYIENPGMAFGIQIGSPIMFTSVSIIATIAIFIYLFKNRNRRFPYPLALAFIFGGAIGNLIDRILYGKVVDFVDIGFGTLRWPVFNVADSSVTIGMVILFLLIIFEKDEIPTDVVVPESLTDTDNPTK